MSVDTSALRPTRPEPGETRPARWRPPPGRIGVGVSAPGRPVGFGLPRAQAAELANVAVRLSEADQVAIVKTALAAGSELHFRGETIRVQQLVPAGHKVALCRVPRGQPIRRYGQVIGFATQDVEPGEHVHSHNLAVAAGRLSLDYAFCSEDSPVDLVPERIDGRSSASVGRMAASVRATTSPYWLRSTARRRPRGSCGRFRVSGILADFPNVDGVIALPHKGGCGAHIGSKHLHLFQRTLAGIVHHPNVGGLRSCSAWLRSEPADRHDARTGGLDKDHPQVITIPRQDWRLSGDGRARHRGGREAAADRERAKPRAGAGLGARGRIAVRRFGRLVGGDRESSSRESLRHHCEAGRHGLSLAETTEVYGARAPAHPPREDAGGRAEADRHDPLVGGLHRLVRRHHRQQSRPRATSSAA